MSHLLSTVNPDAAAALTVEASAPAGADPGENTLGVMAGSDYEASKAAARTALPDIGTMVVYISRPGEGRAGKSEFPAILMHQEPDGTANLLVIYDVDDSVVRPYVGKQSETHQWPAWRPIKRQGDAVVAVASDPALTRMLIDQMAITAQLRADLDRTRSDIYGEYENPGHAIMEIMVSFEQKLKDLTKRIKALEER